jgi:hypothetical protein
MRVPSVRSAPVADRPRRCVLTDIDLRIFDGADLCVRAALTLGFEPKVFHDDLANNCRSGPSVVPEPFYQSLPALV